MTTSVGTERTRSDKRNAANAHAVAVLREVRAELVAEGHAEYSSRAVAKRLAYKSHHSAADLFDETSGAVVELGDPRAIGDELARRTYLRLFAEVDAACTTTARLGEREAMSHLVIRLGKAIEAVELDVARDGTLDEHDKHATALLGIATLAMRAHFAAKRLAREAGK